MSSARHYWPGVCLRRFANCFTRYAGAALAQHIAFKELQRIIWLTWSLSLRPVVSRWRRVWRRFVRRAIAWLWRLVKVGMVCSVVSGSRLAGLISTAVAAPMKPASNLTAYAARNSCAKRRCGRSGVDGGRFVFRFVDGHPRWVVWMPLGGRLWCAVLQALAECQPTLAISVLPSCAPGWVSVRQSVS